MHVDSFGAGGGVRGRQRAGIPEKGRAVVFCILRFSENYDIIPPLCIDAHG